MRSIADLLDLTKMTTAQLFGLKQRVNDELGERQKSFLDELAANEAKKKEASHG